MAQMTKQQAIEALKQASSVKEWNKLREKILKQINPTDLAEIDGSGLIVEVLGKDENK